MDCIFCGIAEGKIPCVKVYEDELVLAFLDIAPICKGHVLVIPKEHHQSIASVPEAAAGRMTRIAARIGIAFKRELDADGFNFHLSDGACAGQVVMHAHIHVVPRNPEDGFHWNWRQLKYASEEERNNIAERIKQKLKDERAETR
jgi:histidine triad (HIT) family protein